MWEDLFAAIALVLVIEGIIPFISPSRWRNAMRLVLEQPDRKIRKIGLVSMLIGVVLLFFIRSH